jgi:signal transduction histidine kinase
LAAKIERKRATLAAVMASMSDGLLVLDAAHQIRYCNPRAGEYLGIDPAPIVHQDIETVISRISAAEAEPDAMRATWQRLILHPEGAASVEIAVSGPPRRTLLVSVFSVADADGARLGLLLQDVTGTKALALLQERERIAMDLHDGVIQSLYGVVLALGVHERVLGWKIEETRQVLQQTRVQIRDIIHEIRSDVFGLRRQRSRYSTLQAGLKALAAEVSIAAVIRVKLDFDAEADFLLDSVSSDSIIRVAREATSNVIRHAQASELTIRLTRADQKLILTVRDNGAGFDPDAADRSVSNPSSGQGLHNMAERALMLGGKLIVRSAPGRGTEIYLKVPV